MDVDTACHRVHIPHGVKAPGTSASGVATAVLFGEYALHHLQSKDGLSLI